MKPGTKYAIALGAVALAGFVVAPIIMAVVQGIMGLILAGGLMLAVIWLGPLFVQWLLNMRVLGTEAIARANPIAELKNALIKKKEMLANYLEQYEKFVARMGIFKTRVDAFSDKYPDAANTYKEQYEAMVRLKEQRKRAYENAKKDIGRFELQVEEAEAKYAMALEAKAMNLAASVENPLDDIKIRAALDEVQMEVNKSLAILERSLMEETEVAYALEDHSNSGSPAAARVRIPVIQRT